MRPPGSSADMLAIRPLLFHIEDGKQGTDRQLQLHDFGDGKPPNIWPRTYYTLVYAMERVIPERVAEARARRGL